MGNEQVTQDKRTRFTFSVPLKEKDVKTEIGSYEKHYGDRSKAIRQIVKDKISLEQENKRLAEENQKQEQYISYLTDIRKPVNPKYPECKFQYPLESDPTKRECTQKDSDRGFNLPKTHGIFIVDNPEKCERCKAGIYKQFKRKRVSAVQPKNRPPSPIQQRKCPMYDGAYVNSEICENCKKRTPHQYMKCMGNVLKTH